MFYSWSFSHQVDPAAYLKLKLNWKNKYIKGQINNMLSPYHKFTMYGRVDPQ